MHNRRAPRRTAQERCLFARFVHSRILRWVAAMASVCLAVLCIGAHGKEATPSARFFVAGIETSRIAFERLAVQDGLSQSHVYCIAQDADGFLWCGTEDGLNRFDGYEFTVYRHDPQDPTTLSDDAIASLCVTRDGAIWAGTAYGGLNRLDPHTGKITVFRHDPNNPASLSEDNIRAICEDRNGRLWVGTGSSGLNLLDPERNTVQVYRHDPSNPSSLCNDAISVIREDHLGNIWVGTDTGLNRLDPETGEWTLYRNNPADPTDLRTNPIRSLEVSSTGMLWAGTNAGILSIDPVTGKSDLLLSEPGSAAVLPTWAIEAICEERPGVLWAGSPQGLYLVDVAARSAGRFVSSDADVHSLGSSNIKSLIKDRAGTLWVGTFLGGLSRYHPRTRPFSPCRSVSRPGAQGGNYVNAILEDSKGRVWVGTSTALQALLPGGTAFDVMPGIPIDLTRRYGVDALAEDKAGRVWAGSRTGLLLLDASGRPGQSYRMYPKDDEISNFITAIAVDSRGMLWVGTSDRGIFSFDPDAKTFTARELPVPNSRLVRRMMFASDGILWIGTGGDGLILYDPAKQAITGRFGKENGLSSDNIGALCEDGQGAVWIGTHNGLHRYVPGTGAIEAVTSPDNIANVAITGLVADEDGNLWIGTLSGLARYSPATNTARVFGTEDGLQGTEFTCAGRGPGGRFYFGGGNGLNHFDPARVRDNDHVPPVLVTAIDVFDNEANLSRTERPRAASEVEIELGYRENFLTFEFAALDFVQPEKNSYAYQLEGVDANWVNCGTRRAANYPNLGPGTYVFRVKGSNNDGVWNERGATVRLRIVPPPWRAWWAYALYFLALLGLVAGAVKWRVSRLERRNRALEDKVARRTAALARTVEQLRQSEALTTEKAAELAETVRKLEQSERRARDASRAKSTFLSSMSHELRTPLNAIIGFAQLIKSKGTVAGEDRKHLDIILRSSNHLLSLINDVLSISKIEAGKYTLNIFAFDLHGLLSGIEEMFRLRAEEKGLRFVVDIAPSVPRFAVGDEGKLRQILINLIGNAFKFTERGEVVVRADWDDGWCTIEVADTGFGISSVELHALFEPFAQTESGQRAQEGTGLGLVICKNFARLMGGDIRVESELGRGATFSVDVPLPETDTDRGEAEVPRVVGLAPGQPVRRMLIVDDTDENRLLLSKLLVSVGFEVREARNGAEAIEAWREWMPDLIWMDVSMPVMGGMEATRRIREEAPENEPPIIAVSASVFGEQREQMIAAGCQGFVVKPYDLATIFRTINEQLGVRFVYSAAREVAAAPEPVTPIDLGGRLALIDGEQKAVLAEALDSGDLEAARNIVNLIAAHDPALAEILRDKIRKYQIDDLLEHFGQPRG